MFRWSFFLFAFYIEDEVAGFLRLRCRVNHQLAVLFQSREPMLYVAGGLIDCFVLNFTVTAKKRRSHFRNQFLAAIGIAAEPN